MADATTAAAAPAEHTYTFNVAMSCGGCSGAIERVLKRLEGVKSYTVSLDSQTATVVAEPSLPYEKVLKTIAKTGKKVNTGEADGVPQSVEVPAE
ncbi:Cytosolic copper metallochaperone [Collariella sp. IMI 366227]|nr:Cytosolic copper metallochaperone [Collariella sp. IMI 366227]